MPPRSARWPLTPSRAPNGEGVAERPRRRCTVTVNRAACMDAWRRNQYLKAMGVSLWRRRNLPDEAHIPHSPGSALSAMPNRPHSPQPTTEPASATPRPPASEGPGGSLGSSTPITTLDWEALRRTVNACRACPLCETRTQTVFGVGNPKADLMLIGEAPGADEDRAGEPFVGRAGQLLTLMLQAIGMPREQVYIANILKCRPPGNRDPLADEVMRCEPYLLRQIALISPRVILALGRISAQALLRTDTPIGRLRGRWYQYGEARYPLYVTYHPAYLLRSPAQKADAWQDLLVVRRRLLGPTTDEET